MKTLLNTIVIALALSTAAFAQDRDVTTTTRSEKPVVCNCECRYNLKTETMKNFLRELQQGELSQPGIVIEPAGQTA